MALRSTLASGLSTGSSSGSDKVCVGYYAGCTSTGPDQAVQAKYGNDDVLHGLEQPFRRQDEQTAGFSPEGDIMILPPTTYRAPPKEAAKEVRSLNSTPTQRPDSHHSCSRSPRFREHISEVENPSSSPNDPRASAMDSPTLGRPPVPPPNASLADQVRRRQHLLS